MNAKRHPCADGLTPACFQAYPDWAKMRFALKLMSTLFPAEITKRLPVEILEAMEQMPPDWPAGEALPPALSLAPPPGIIVPPGGVAAPLYTAPFSAGPPNPPAGKNPEPETAPWFYDKFTTLDLTVWTEYNFGAATNTIDAGRLKQTCPLGTAAEIDTAEDATIPAAFNWTFDLTYDTDLGGTFYPYVYTGAHALELDFNPPTTLRFHKSTGWQSYTIANFLGTTDSWKLVYTGTLASLYRGSTAIFTDLAPWVRLTNPGIIHIVSEDGTIYLDELKIEEI